MVPDDRLPPAPPDESVHSRSLMRWAIALAAFGVVVGCGVGYYSYVTSREALLDLIYESNHQLAVAMAVHVDALGDEHSRQEALAFLEEMWRAYGRAYPGSHLCVIDRVGTVGFDSVNPDMVGTDVSGREIRLSRGEGTTTLGQVAGGGLDAAGVCSVVDDPGQIGAFAHSRRLDSMISVFVPGAVVDRRVRATTIPWAASMAVLGLLVVPLSGGLLYRAFRVAQEQLYRTNTRLVTEVREREHAQEALRRLASFPRLNPNVVIETDASAHVHYANPSAEHLFGPDLDAPSIHPFLADLDQAADTLRRRESSSLVREVCLHRTWYQQVLYYVADTDRLRIYAFDITERRTAEERTRRALEEKEVLLQEVYHRVKNNMQIISSLLSHQAAATGDRHAAAALRESRDRVRSMALIHQELYQSSDLARVRLDRYLEKLTAGLLQSYAADTSRVQLCVDVHDVTFGIETAIPLGLIVNELVSNAIKHAFPDGRSGTITVCLAPESEGCYQLVVGDDGVGDGGAGDGLAGAGVAGLQRPGSLGLRIVSDLTRQLGGRIAVGHEGGTEFRLTFSEPEGTA